jgi:hypothetical protein
VNVVWYSGKKRPQVSGGTEKGSESRKILKLWAAGITKLVNAAAMNVKTNPTGRLVKLPEENPERRIGSLKIDELVSTMRST